MSERLDLGKTLDDDLPGVIEGQFDHHDPAFIATPWRTYEQARDRCPVAHTDAHGGYWLVSRYDDVVDFAAQWESFTSTGPGLLIPPGTARDFPFLPLELDPPKHTDYRRLIAPLFAPRAVNGMSERVRAWAADILTPLLQSGECDLATDFCPAMSAGTLAMFIGIPATDRDIWLDFVRRSFEGTVHDPQDAVKAGREFNAYVDGLVAARRETPADDLVSLLVTSTVNGEPLTDQEIRGFLVLILVAGHETTASTMAHMFWHLAQHPENVQRLRDEPELVPVAVEEYVRLASPVSIFSRHATADVEYQGQQIFAGETIGLSFASANRDAAKFDDPDDFSFERKPNRHVGFGSGIHTCLGSPLARLEIATSLRLFLDSGLSMSLAPGRDIAWKGRGDALSLASVPVVFEGARQ
jgi:cytochrome P450